MESPDGIWKFGLKSTVRGRKVALAISPRGTESLPSLDELRKIIIVSHFCAVGVAQWRATAQGGHFGAIKRHTYHVIHEELEGVQRVFCLGSGHDEVAVPGTA